MLEIITKNTNWLYFKLFKKFKKTGPTNANHFLRLEDKYILPKALAEALLPIIKTHLDNASPVPGTEFTLIESIYFDSSELRTLTEYLSQEAQRSKLRTRRYAPNAAWSNDIFIELKYKNHGISKKSRLIITDEQKNTLFAQRGIEIAPPLLNLNPNVSRRKIQKHVYNINYFIETLAVLPMCKIMYSRQAFEKNDFRVTLDKDISWEMLTDVTNKTINQIKDRSQFTETLQKVQKSYSSDFYVLEVKHSGKIPAWLSDYLTQHSIAETSFSKYCYGMSYLFNNEVSETNSNMKSYAK